MNPNDKPPPPDPHARLVTDLRNVVRGLGIDAEQLATALETHFVARAPEAPPVRCGSCMDDMSNRCEDCGRTVFCGICKTYDLAECGEYEEHRAHAAASATPMGLCRCMHPMHEGKACGHTWSPKLPAMPRCQCPGNDDWESRQSGPPVWIPIKAWGASHIAMASATKDVAEERAKITGDGAVPSLWVHASALTAAVRTASSFAALAEQVVEHDGAHYTVSALLDFLESSKAPLHGSIHQMSALHALVARARLALTSGDGLSRASSMDDIYLLRYSDDQTLYTDHVFTSRQDAQDYADVANESGNFRPGITLTVEGPYLAPTNADPVLNAQWHDAKTRLDTVDSLLRAIIVFAKKPSELHDTAQTARSIILAPPADGSHWVNLLEEAERKRADLVGKLAESEVARETLHAEVKKLSEQQALSDRLAAEALKERGELTDIFMRAVGGNIPCATRRRSCNGRIMKIGISPADAVAVKTLLNTLVNVNATTGAPPEPETAAHAALPLWAIWRRPQPLPPNGGETERYPRDYKPTNQVTAESVAKTMNESGAWPAWIFEARPEAKG